MKSQEPKEKKFRQLSDEELELVTGGADTPFDIGGDCSGPHQHEFELKCICDLGYHYIGGHVCEKD